MTVTPAPGHGVVLPVGQPISRRLLHLPVPTFLSYSTLDGYVSAMLSLFPVNILSSARVRKVPSLLPYSTASHLLLPPLRGW